MLNLKENRDRLIKRAISSIKTTALLEDANLVDIQEFEYEPSEIIRTLFESDNDVEVNAFQSRKLKKSKKIKDKAFFSNSESYIKKI